MSQVWTPREHQLLAAQFLFDNKRCSLWAHPGLGKTSICYRLFDLMQMCGSNYFPALVVAPLAVARDVWPDEQRKWSDFTGLRVVNITGTALQRAACLTYRAEVYTINYENLTWLVNFLGDRWPFRMVIADESTRLRGFRLMKKGTKRATALQSVAHKTGRWINLTGTPSPHGLESLWGQQYFIDYGGRLGMTYGDFMSRWFSVDAYTREVTPRPGAREQIYAALADCTMALRAEDWLDVKEPHFFRKDVKLPDDARAHYRTMERKMFTELADNRILAINGAVKTLKLIQIASRESSMTQTETITHFMRRKSRLYAHFTTNSGSRFWLSTTSSLMQERMVKEFPECRIYRGPNDAADWNAGKLRMMLIHPKSAGHGLSLQHGGRAVCFYTNTWDLELRLQALERIGPARQLLSGYDRAVLIYDLVAEATVDTDVLNRLEGRATEQEALMAARARALSS